MDEEIKKLVIYEPKNSIKTKILYVIGKKNRMAVIQRHICVETNDTAYNNICNSTQQPLIPCSLGVFKDTILGDFSFPLRNPSVSDFL